MKKRELKNIMKAMAAALLLTGCSDLIEIQDRDFVLALGVSFEEEYELTFALPEFTGEEGKEKKKGLTRSYTSASPDEIEYLYNRSSNKRLDYRHLEALIIDESAGRSLKGLLGYMENKHEISRDVRVFYYPGDVKTLLETKAETGGGIGNYLKKLEKNNQLRNQIPSVTLGDFFIQNKALAVPVLKSQDEKLETEGAAIFKDSAYVKNLTAEEFNIYHLIKGNGKELNFNESEELVFKLTGFKSRKRYSKIEGKPFIELDITGTAEVYKGGGTEGEIEDYLWNAIAKQIETCFRQDGLDYFNFYEASATKNKSMWLDYANRQKDFIKDITFSIETNIDMGPLK